MPLSKNYKISIGVLIGFFILALGATALTLLLLKPWDNTPNFIHGSSKDVVISSFYITDTYEPSGVWPKIVITCYSSTDEQLATNELNKLIQTNNEWYVIETQLFQWEPVLEGSSMYCKVTEGSNNLGSTALIDYDDILYDGMSFSTISPAQAQFVLRCGDCLPSSNYSIMTGAGMNKVIAVQSMQISSTPESSPDIYIKCAIAEPSETYKQPLSKVKSANVAITVNLKIADFVWNNATDGLSATCGVFESNSDSVDDSYGTVIIHYDDITDGGYKYSMPNDADTWFVLFNCTSPDLCNESSRIAVNWSIIVLNFVGFGLLTYLHQESSRSH